MISRNWAALILIEVGEMADYGSYPLYIDPREVGWALKRALVNAPEGGLAAFVRLTQGFLEAVRYEAEGIIPDDLR